MQKNPYPYRIFPQGSEDQPLTNGQQIYLPSSSYSSYSPSSFLTSTEESARYSPSPSSLTSTKRARYPPASSEYNHQVPHVQTDFSELIPTLTNIKKLLYDLSTKYTKFNLDKVIDEFYNKIHEVRKMTRKSDAAKIATFFGFDKKIDPKKIQSYKHLTRDLSTGIFDQRTIGEFLNKFLNKIYEKQFQEKVKNRLNQSTNKQLKTLSEGINLKLFLYTTLEAVLMKEKQRLSKTLQEL